MPKKTEERNDVQEICAGYFETHFSPLLKFIQHSQDLMNDKLADSHANVQKSIHQLGEQLVQKADASDVCTRAELAEFVAKSPSRPRGDSGESSSVPMLKRMQELAAKVSQKADASDVARLSALIESKANTRDVPVNEQRWRSAVKDVPVNSPTQSQLQDRLAVVEEKIGSSLQECMAQLDRLNASLAKKADREDAPTLDQLQELRTELLSVSSCRATVDTGGTGSGTAENKVEMKKMQVLIAAAGARFEKQLKDVRQQVLELKQQKPVDALGDRWPGRVLPSLERTPSDDDGTADDVQSVPGSVAESLAYSVTGLSPEERAELKKMQTVVAAAGAAFSREMKAIKHQLHELRGELGKVKQQLGLQESVPPLKPNAQKPTKAIDEIE